MQHLYTAFTIIMQHFSAILTLLLRIHLKCYLQYCFFYEEQQPVT